VEQPVAGDVVVVPFPFSDLSQAKRRPALVIADAGGNDLILCQITSRPVRDQWAIAVDDAQFQSGGLRQPSNVRPNRIFTADRQIVLYTAGRLADESLATVRDSVVRLIQS